VGIKRSKITNIFINEKTLKTIQFFMVLATWDLPKNVKMAPKMGQHVIREAPRVG
jgi:hypothetical protein